VPAEDSTFSAISTLQSTAHPIAKLDRNERTISVN
jgi:hypothetical protein